MARERTARRGTRHRLLKAESMRATVDWIVCTALPAVEHEGLGPHQLDVDPEVGHPFARAEEAKELAQAVAVRDHVDLRPVDGRCLVTVYLICGSKEGKHRILEQACPGVVDKNGAVIGLQLEWDSTPRPYGRGT